MQRIILDTNFLLIPAQFKVDIFSEIERIMDDKYEIFVLSGSLRELERMGGTDARIALSLAKNLRVIESEGYVDSDLARMSEDSIIATQDKELKQRLKGPVIILRQKKYLEIKCFTRQK